MIDHNIVLITDEKKEYNFADLSRKDLEGNNASSTESIIDALNKICKKVIHYTDLELFTTNIPQHKDDIIFPMRFGENSPNSKSLLPAICEANNLKYVGGDSFTHSLCNDKHLSKLYAKEFGISVPKGFLVRKLNDRILEYLPTLNLPLVIKPNYGGGSTGISNNNLVYSYNEAEDLINKLFVFHNIPIIVEEYIEGYEVEYSIFGNKNKIILSGEAQLKIDETTFFKREIWGYETKKIDDSSVDFLTSNLIPTSVKEKMITLFKSFDKIEFMRVDGRISNDEFYLIELSPDCFLGKDCAFYHVFAQNNLLFEEMFESLIINAANLC
ncbi:D-alanine-D-alanine ligase [Paenibacillus polysaccharolyticus]|uniref:D-alanine-D-alanine ligase n=1 Tax=Paenibacillus polysaccharolyticus TaxID=582692 RepID=A0A1G5IN81_9BACL|nr:hypothetical protein [Paenibacillus polysaccharolyticus]SCY77522.1 D-alanine-D-alanine ligase [Paenibacillus polysaccharolyticus]